MQPRAVGHWLGQPLVPSFVAQLCFALDAIHTAQHRPARSACALFVQAFRYSTSKYDRVGALAQWAEVTAPSLMRRVHRRLQRVDRLSLRCEALTSLAFGKGSSCFVVDSAPPLVLKVLRRSLGKDPSTLAKLARGLRDDYQTLERWYADVPGLFPRTMHLVLHSPLRGVGAAARVQPFVRGPTRDLLREFTDAELASLMSRTPRLGERIRSFAAATRRAWDEEDRFLDMIGDDNVLLVEGPSGPDLCVIDFGIWDLKDKRRKAPKVYAEAARIVERLERLAGRRD